jgi:hypothetical protein
MRSRIRLTAACWAILLVAAVVRAAAPGTDSEANTLRQRERELNTQLLEEKTRILRSDPEARRIQTQIEKLYRDLEKIVQSKPSVAKIQAERDAVRKQLLTRSAGSETDNRQ